MTECPDCGIEEREEIQPQESGGLPLKPGATVRKSNILNPTTLLSMEDEVIERELECLNCGHKWTEEKDRKDRQTSLRREVRTTVE